MLRKEIEIINRISGGGNSGTGDVIRISEAGKQSSEASCLDVLSASHI